MFLSDLLTGHEPEQAGAQTAESARIHSIETGGRGRPLPEREDSWKGMKKSQERVWIG